MPAKIAKYVLNEELYNTDTDIIIEDQMETIIVQRRASTGNGFNIELGDYTNVGSITGRVDNISAIGDSRYKRILSIVRDVKTIENRFVGITKDAGIGVYIGDIWLYQSTKYFVEKFITQGQLKSEVILRLFTPGQL